MATPELAIAKATLSATLFRADPTSLSRPSVDAFFPLLSSAIAQCSRPNVQKCKAWIVDNIAHSNARTTALAKFLVTLSKNFSQDDGEKPSAKRRRLHVLYVVNDVLYNVVEKRRDGKFATAWEVALPSLIAAAAAFENCPKHKKKLEDLINLWDDKQYFSSSFISQLRDAYSTGSVATPAVDPQASASSIKLAKDAPYVLPSIHGDSSTPWYDLPAATWLPHFTPNSTKPMIPDLIKPIHLSSGPADKVLANAVRNLLSDVERLYSKEPKWEDDPHVDLNELGERVTLDEVTGEIIGGETYYGWSRGFCEKMKERRKKKTRGHDRGRSDSRSVSRGRSRSSSAPAFKRRRFSPDSRSRSPSPNRGQNRLHPQSRSYSRSRSRSHDRRRSHHRRSYSRSRSRSHSPHRGHRGSPSRSPPRPPTTSNRPHRTGPDHPPPHQQQFNQHPNFPPVPPPGNFPIPPPPPVGYQGPWPPPLPQMGGGSGTWFPNNPGMMPPQMMGGWQVPPPPPGPPQNGYGRGSGGYRGRGRGGYDRGGRGGW